MEPISPPLWGLWPSQFAYVQSESFRDSPGFLVSCDPQSWKVTWIRNLNLINTFSPLSDSLILVKRTSFEPKFLRDRATVMHLFCVQLFGFRSTVCVLVWNPFKVQGLLALWSFAPVRVIVHAVFVLFHLLVVLLSAHQLNSKCFLFETCLCSVGAAFWSHAHTSRLDPIFLRYNAEQTNHSPDVWISGPCLPWGGHKQEELQ